MVGRRICILAYDFPPANTGGAHRPLRFSELLSGEGYEPHVFAISNHDSDQVVDPGFGSLIPLWLKVERTPLRRRYIWEHPKVRFYYSPEDECGGRWRQSLLERMQEVWNTEPFEAILVTAPPFSVLGVAVVAKDRFRVPLIIDLRDPWSSCVISPFPSVWHYRRLLRVEENLLKAASEIIVATPGMRRDLLRLHPELPAQITVIPNGFSHPVGDFSAILDPPHESVTIGYVGKFYFNTYSHNLIFSPWYRKKPHQMFQYTPRREDWSYRSPLYFLRAVSRLLERSPNWRRCLRIKIADTQPDSIHEMVRRLGLGDVVDFVGFVQKLELPAFYAGCNYLLMTSAKVEQGGDYCIAGKSCEYVAMRRPILGFVCPGDQRDFLVASGLATIFEPDQPELSAIALERLFTERRVFTPDWGYLANFGPEVAARALSSVVSRALRNRR